MSTSPPPKVAARCSHAPASRRSGPGPTTGITVFECDEAEAALFDELGHRLGVLPTTTTEAPTERNVGALAAGNRSISVGHKSRLTRQTLVALRYAGVRYISTRSIGRDHIDLAHAAALGIRVENVAYSPDSVADHAVMLMLMAIRGVKPVLQRAEVHDYRLSAVPARELRDLTVGVVGTGRIGTAVIARLAGFSCRVLSHDPCSTGTAAHVGLDELLAQSDIVTLHTPLEPGTHHLLDRRRIARLRPGAFVVNTARGGLIDTEALLEALETGRLGGAALDVLEGEERTFYADRRNQRIDNVLLLRLQEMPQVLLTQHTAYYTDHALRDAVESSIRGCLAFERGEHRGDA